MSSVMLRTRIAHFKNGSASPANLLEYFDDGIIIFDKGRVALIGNTDTLVDQGLDITPAQHHPKALLFSGFIDSHVHAPQLDVMGAYGEQLLDWLEHYTFPAEMRFANAAYTETQTRRFLDALLANGTTSAMVFTTSHRHSADQLFEQANERNMRLLAGKVLMDRNAPEALLDTVETGRSDNQYLIDRWHGKGRLGYALTPRFSITSTPEQLSAAGEQLAKYPDLWMQTHLSENTAEIAWIKSLFPNARDYLDTYQAFGLLSSRSVFAHGIHLSDHELDRLAEHKAAIAFCPSSNLFLGSGLLNVERVKSFGVDLALASDVGAGTQLSMLGIMGEAYKVCQLQGYSLSPAEAFYMATAGAAKALKLEAFIGNLEEGKEADAVLLNPKLHPFINERIERCKNIDEELFVYMTMADERIIERTYIAGVLQHCQENNEGAVI